MNPDLDKTMKNDLKKIVYPSEQFTQKAKGRFLATFDAKHGTRPQPAGHRMTAWAKAFIVIGALAAVMVSVSAYADTANVAADNPLYPFKRLSENVRLALTPKNEQAQVEASLAVRRANEIADLSTRKPTSTIIASLSSDFQNDVSSSLGDLGAENDGNVSLSSNATATPSPTAARIPAAVSPHATSTSATAIPTPTIRTLGTGSLSCDEITSILSGSLAARVQISSNASLLARLEGRCGEIDSARVSATSSFQARIPVPIHPTPTLKSLL